MDDDDEILDYLPIIGDIYRCGKLCYKITRWFSDDNETDELLCKMYCAIQDAVDAINANVVSEALKSLSVFSVLSYNFDGRKKYQKVLYLYLHAKGMHLYTLCQWASLERFPTQEEKVAIENNFHTAAEICDSIGQINKTLFTEQCDLIDNLRIEAKEERSCIDNSCSLWKQYCKAVDKTLHPWKYRLMWIVPLVVLLMVVVFSLCVIMKI